MGVCGWKVTSLLPGIADEHPARRCFAAQTCPDLFVVCVCVCVCICVCVSECVCVEIIIVYVTTCVVCVRGLIGEGCLSNVECVVCECACVCVWVCVCVCVCRL